MPAVLAVTLTLVAGFYFLRKEEVAQPAFVPARTDELVK